MSTSIFMSMLYAGYEMFETKQYCGFISLKRDMLFYVRCIYTVSRCVTKNCMSINYSFSLGRWEVCAERCINRGPRISITGWSSKSRCMSDSRLCLLRLKISSSFTCISNDWFVIIVIIMIPNHCWYMYIVYIIIYLTVDMKGVVYVINDSLFYFSI